MKTLALVQTTKPRILLLVVFSTCAGFLMASKDVSAMLLFHAFLGTGLVCASCNALNQLLERDVDAKMRRTRNRPLPTGRLRPYEVSLFGCALGLTGILELVLCVNIVTAILGAFALGTYLFVYTPLKRKTPWSTWIGAVPGAMPVLMGWTAIHRDIGWGGCTLFAIVFLWQLPHFFAIATMYRDDYAAANLRMLPVLDGPSANRQIVIYSVGLLVLSLFPATLGLAGGVYFWAALILGIAFSALGFCFMTSRYQISAKALFVASILYLPALFAFMVVDKT